MPDQQPQHAAVLPYSRHVLPAASTRCSCHPTAGMYYQQPQHATVATLQRHVLPAASTRCSATLQHACTTSSLNTLQCHPTAACTTSSFNTLQWHPRRNALHVLQATLWGTPTTSCSATLAGTQHAAVQTQREHNTLQCHPSGTHH